MHFTPPKTTFSMKNLLFFAVLFWATKLCAQTTEPDRLLDFKVEANGDIQTFTPIMPPALQKPGAPKAFWSYFWEFGDGSFSREENPNHIYANQGDYVASLDATAHYDDGKKARKKKKPVNAHPASRLTKTSPQGEDAFDPAGTPNGRHVFLQQAKSRRGNYPRDQLPESGRPDNRWAAPPFF